MPLIQLMMETLVACARARVRFSSPTATARSLGRRGRERRPRSITNFQGGYHGKDLDGVQRCQLVRSDQLEVVPLHVELWDIPEGEASQFLGIAVTQNFTAIFRHCSNPELYCNFSLQFFTRKNKGKKAKPRTQA